MSPLTTPIPHSAPTVGPAEMKAVEAVFQSGQLAQGREVEAFESECADFTQTRHGVAVSSGTAALHLALNAAGVAAGDRVAAPTYACAALLTAIHLQNATALLCDVGDDYNIDRDTVPESSPTTIVPHLFGAPAALPRSGLVIEDLAQSLGGGRVNTPLAIASFYATKLISTGEGGMVLTDEESLAQQVRDCRDYDNRDRYARRFNYKMTDFQAAMGRVQLRRLPQFIERRREIALRYQEAFQDLPLRLPNPAGHIFFRYAVATESREALEAHVNSEGIEAKRPVYCPAHHYFQGAGPHTGIERLEAYPGADRAHDRVVSLPIFPSMVDEQVERVIDSIEAFFH